MLPIWGPVSREKRLWGARGMRSAVTSRAASCCNVWDMQGKWEGLQMAMYHHPGLSLWFSINSYISSTHRLEFQFPFLCSTCQATFPFLL